MKARNFFPFIIKIAIPLSCTFVFTNLSCAEDKAYEVELEQISKEPLKKQRKLLFSLAEKLEANNQPGEAILVYRQIISLNACLNNAIKAWLAIADIYKKQNQCQKSLEELDALGTLLPENKEVQQKRFEVLVKLARIDSKNKDAKNSTSYYKLALEANPEDRLQILRQYADQLTLNSEAHLAIPLYQEVLESNLSQKEKKKALIGLARAYTWRENYPEAIETNQKVLEIDPQYNPYHFFLTLARDAALHKKPEIAAEYYNKALEADPSQLNVLLREYAKQLSYAYRAEEAIILYKEHLNTQLSPEESRLTRLDLAQAYVWTKQFPLAIAEYETLLSQNPNDIEARNAFVELLISFARFDAKNYNHTSALNWYLSAMSFNPETRTSLLREYADEVARSGHGPDAIALYKEVLFNCPSKEEARLANLGLAQTYIWVNKHEDALNIYDELLKLNPNDTVAKKGKVQVYVDYARNDANKGNHSQSIVWFKKAISLLPEEKSTLSKELADQLYYNSQVDDAIALYNEILNAKPTGDYERDVRLSLAKAYTSKFLYEDALKEYDILLQENKYDQISKQGRAQIFVEYAVYNSKQGKHTEAIDWYNKAIENDPVRRPELLQKIDEEKRVIQVNKTNEAPKEAPQINQEMHPPVNPEPVEPPKQASAGVENKNETPGNIPTTSSQEQNPSSNKAPEQVSTDLIPKEYAPEITPSNTPQECFSSPAQLSAHAPTVENSPQELAKKANKSGKEHAERLEVFLANRAFGSSVELDPNNKGYREQYAWHLQAFSFTEEAVHQFNILLPLESDQTLFYQVLGWDYHKLGQLDASIWAFSHIYDIPPYYALKNKFIVIDQLYRRSEYDKINALRKTQECPEEKKSLEIKKKLFESYSYIGELEKASPLALEILSTHPEEYMVQYRYAKLLHQKKKYCEAIVQYKLLLEKLPSNAFLYLSLGKVYEDRGCKWAAKNSYETAFYLDPNPYTERSYARILSKLGDCCDAEALTSQIVADEFNGLTKSLSAAEVSLNCGDEENAAGIYKDILCNYPYNQEALWGLLKSSTYTKNSSDAIISYKRWPILGFEVPLQNQLADYYRPREMLQSNEFFQNSVIFRRFSTGLGFNQYLFSNMRLYEGYYYTQFGEVHFDTINRHTGFIALNKLFNKEWESRIGLLGNYYDHLQRRSKNLAKKQQIYSKVALNTHLHTIYHPIPELSVDFGYDYYDVIDTVPPFNNPLYNYIIQIGAAALNIRTQDLDAFFYFSKEKFYWLLNVVYGRYSDGNIKKTRSFRTGYRIFDLPATNIYYSYFYLDYKKPAPLFVQNGFSESAYYDPINLEIHSIGTDTKYDVTNTFQVGGELAVLYIPKCSNFAYSSFAYLSYEFTDRWSCRLDLRYYYQTKSVTRTGITGYYNAENASLQIKYRY